MEYAYPIHQYHPRSDTTRIRDTELMDLPLAGSCADGNLISVDRRSTPSLLICRLSFFFLDLLCSAVFLAHTSDLCRWFEISFACFLFSFAVFYLGSRL